MIVNMTLILNNTVVPDTTSVEQAFTKALSKGSAYLSVEIASIRASKPHFLVIVISVVKRDVLCT